MEAELLNVAAGLGVGGLLAVIIFLMYRADRKANECQMIADREASEKQIREDRKFMEDRLTGILEKDQETREANTKALTELTTVLHRINDK